MYASITISNDHDTTTINVFLELPPENDCLLLQLLLHLGQVLILLLQLRHLGVKLGNSLNFPLSKISFDCDYYLLYLIVKE